MWNNEKRVYTGGRRAAIRIVGRVGEAPASPCLRGVAGRLRPYGDVRAGFERWRRVALLAWAARDEAATVH